MKIYIATKFEDVTEYKELENILVSDGHSITCDWTAHKSVHPFSDDRPICRSQSEEDLSGIRNSDVVILLYNGKKGSGMSFEIGYATALNKKVVMLGENSEDYSMFVHLDNFIHCSNIQEMKLVLDEYKRYRKEKR